jgi:polyisoprenyl-phosphate glycosyltransferase
VTSSIVIPVYRNEQSLPELIAAMQGIGEALHGELEVVFVVDGSPDRSWAVLSELLPASGLRAQLLLLSRNFGSFAALRAGLQVATGDRFAVMAADLQEPPEFMVQALRELDGGDVDVVIGTREGREDPLASRFASAVFWGLYRRFVVPEMPRGGVDIFACNRPFRDQLLRLEESHSSLISMLFWLGFRRKAIGYRRVARRHGTSAWTLRKRLRYLSDSIFAFTDLPNRLLIWVGGFGVAVSAILGLITVVARVTGFITVPGYAATILVIAFFGALNLFGLGLVGSYAWRAYENSKGRPLAIVQSARRFG